MKRYFFFILCFLNTLEIFPQTFEWAKSVSSTISQGKKIVCDENGNIYTSGILSSNFGLATDFDFGPNIYNLAPGVGNSNAYIAKYNSNGDFLWAKLLYVQNFNNHIEELKLDKDNNVFFIGQFKGTVDFDMGPGAYNLTNNHPNQEQTFVEKLDSNGNFLWVKKIGDTTGYTLNSSFSVSDQGDIILISGFYGTLDFNPNIGVYYMTATGNYSNTFILKLNNSGNFVWACQIEGGGNTGKKIITDKSNYLYLAGNFSSVIDADPNMGTFQLTGSSNNNLYVIKLDSLTNLVWARYLSSINFFSNLILSDIQSDKNCNLFYAGYFSDSVDFNINLGVDTHNSNGTLDAFFSKIDSAGNYVWTKTFGGPFAEQVNQIILDTFDNSYLLGRYIGAVDLDPSPNGTYIVNGGKCYISKLDSTGIFSGAFSFSTPNVFGGLIGESFAYDNNDNIIMTGFFEGTQDFDPGAGVFNLTSPGVGNFMFIEKFGFCGTYHDSSITHCNTINLWGATYDSSQQFVQMFSDGNECDSNINVNLTIIYGPTDTLNQTECNSFTINNVTYTAGGLHVQNYPIGGTCDSLFVINLSLLNPGTINITQAVDTLQAYPSGYTYQWLDCTTNLPIAGATDSVYVPSGNGSYKAVVYFGANCSDTTGCKAISKGEGVNDFSLANFSIKPNPTEGHFEIVNKGYKGSLAVKITDIFGKKIFLKEFKQNDNLNFNLNNFCNGLYIIELDVEKRTLFFKIVKQQ